MQTRQAALVLAALLTPVPITGTGAEADNTARQLEGDGGDESGGDEAEIVHVLAGFCSEWQEGVTADGGGRVRGFQSSFFREDRDACFARCAAYPYNSASNRELPSLRPVPCLVHSR